MGALLITGTSGFLGSAVVHQAAGRGRGVRAMVRRANAVPLLEDVRDRIEIVEADMAEPGSLAPAVEGADAVVHCAAATSEATPDLERSRRVNVDGTRALIEHMRRHGARRLIAISSQSAHARNPSVYGRTKYEQQQIVMASADVDWTILRPNLIYGAQAKGLFHKIVGHCRRLPVVPVIGSGQQMMRPIRVDEVAWAALACLDEPRTIGKVYNLDGAEALSFNDFVRTILEVIGRRKMLVHLPVPVALALARALSLVLENPPITPDNVIGLDTAQVADGTIASTDEFEFQPRPFSSGLREVLAVR